MTQKLLINVSVEETRVALVESGHLENLEIDTRHLEEAKGNIYKARVHRVNASLQAAFVDYGADKQGFLPIAEIHPRYYPEAVRGKRVSINEVLKNGQEMMVQVVKDEIGNKGASLTTFVSLPGRYLVLMAQTDKTGISRRLPNDERTRLKRIIDSLEVPDGFGCIIRTAGVGRDEDELGMDLEYLKRLWAGLEERFNGLRNPGVIHQERSTAMRFLRDYASDSLEEIIVDDIDVAEEIRDFCTILVPELRNKVTVYDDPTPLFSRYQVEDQIDDIFARRIDLPSGGYIIIDQTEAMVSVDVNSGRVKTDDIEQTALTTNLESAKEVARQLKIRDLGGLVVVDFIDMRERGNIKEVEQTAKDAFADDKAKVKFTRISDFGLMEISRQRLKTSITKGSFSSCHSCGGTGMLRSVESSSLYLLRRLKETVIRGSYLHAVARMPMPIANYLANRKRRELIDLEYQTKTTIEVRGLKDCPPTKAYVELLTRPQRGKQPKRFIQTYDLVRSDVDKQEMPKDDDFMLDSAEARGIHLTDDDWKKLYRRIEKDMASEAEKRLEKKEKLALEAEKRAEAAEARAETATQEVVDAEAKIVEMAQQKGFKAWVRRLFGAGPPTIIIHAPPLAVEDKRGGGGSGRSDSRRDERSGRDRNDGDRGQGRGGRNKPASERIRSRNQGPRSRPLKAKEVENSEPARRAEEPSGPKRKRRRRKRSDGDGGDNSPQDSGNGKSDDGVKNDGGNSSGVKNDGGNSGSGKGNSGKSGGRGGKGGKGSNESKERSEKPPANEANDNSGQQDQGGDEPSSPKRRRRRRKRNDGDGIGQSDGGAQESKSDGGSASSGGESQSAASSKDESGDRSDAKNSQSKPKPKPKNENSGEGDGPAKSDAPKKAAAKPDKSESKPAAKPEAKAAAKPEAKSDAKSDAPQRSKKPSGVALAVASGGEPKPKPPARPKASARPGAGDGGSEGAAEKPKVPKKGGVIDLRGAGE